MTKSSLIRSHKKQESGFRCEITQCKKCRLVYAVPQLRTTFLRRSIARWTSSFYEFAPPVAKTVVQEFVARNRPTDVSCSVLNPIPLVMAAGTHCVHSFTAFHPVSTIPEYSEVL